MLSSHVLSGMSHRGLWAAVMLPLAWLYGWLSARHRSATLAQQEPLPVPVIVIGNVVLGGTGKTPIVAAVVAHLRRRGWRPGILSRGYGSNLTQTAEPLDVGPQTPVGACGDEPKWLHNETGVPVMVHPDRVLAAKTALSKHPHIDILVSDDGLQHLRLPRTVEIVVFDERGIGNGRLLPAGLLREPWDLRPRRQPVIGVINSQNGRAAAIPTPPSENTPFFNCQRSLADLFHRLDGEQQSRLTGAVQVVTAIAKPTVLIDMLRERGQRDGFHIDGIHVWPDHAALDRMDLSSVSAGTVICTAKDAVKLLANPSVDPKRCWIAPLTLSLNTEFWEALDAALPPQSTRSELSLPHGHKTT